MCWLLLARFIWLTTVSNIGFYWTRVIFWPQVHLQIYTEESAPSCFVQPCHSQRNIFYSATLHSTRYKEMFCQTAKMNSRQDKSEKTDLGPATQTAVNPTGKLFRLAMRIFLWKRHSATLWTINIVRNKNFIVTNNILPFLYLWSLPYQ